MTKQLKLIIELTEEIGIRYELAIGYRYDQIFDNLEELKKRVCEVIDKKFKED